MSTPRPLALIVLLVAITLYAAAFGLTRLYPAAQAGIDSQFDSLQAEERALAPASDAAVQAVKAKLDGLRGNLWTNESLGTWRQSHLPAGWTMEDMGAAGLAHLQGRLFAISRPAASDREWPEITSVLQSLESAHGVSVQSADFAVGSGYAASRRFTQCRVVALFYHEGDDVPTLGR